MLSLSEVVTEGQSPASELSTCVGENGERLKICVLERGKEYLPGAFPNRQADLAGHVRFATPDAPRQRGVYDGLYDIRWSEDAVAIVASGLGGGSLINAGVMEMPKAEVFQESRWPRAIRDDTELDQLARKLRPLLGAKEFPFTEQLKKTAQLKQLAKKHNTSLTQITVAGAGGPNSAGVMLNECRKCGDCATGCNYGAKDSLDLNLLAFSMGARCAACHRCNRIAARRRGWRQGGVDRISKSY